MEYCYQFGRSEDFHPSYIHLTVKDKDALLSLKDELNAQGIQTAEFHEPYSNWGLTSISCCLPESKRKMLSHLKLWSIKEK